MMFYVYILYSEKLGTYYTGQTNNLLDRINRHNLGQENYTSKGVPWAIKWSKSLDTREQAMALEKQIKKRGAKRYLIDIGELT